MNSTGVGVSSGPSLCALCRSEGRRDARLAKEQLDHALFIAFAPVEAPRVAVAVIVENGEHGSSTAAPVARRVIDTYMATHAEVAGLE